MYLAAVSGIPQSVTVVVPGSSANLGPGFDCLGVALPLYLTVSIARHLGALTVVTTGEGQDELPRDASNLVVSTLLGEIGGDGSGLEIMIENELPLAAGCGSSGAAIVAGLAAAAALSGRPLDRPALLVRAAELEGHPDNVAASVYGGFSVSWSEPVGARSVPPPLDLRFVLVTPDERLATAKARAALPPTLPFPDAVFNVQRVALLVAALAAGDLGALPLALADRLHQSRRAHLVPTYERLSGAAAELGSLGVTLSGAGPSVLLWTTRGVASELARRVGEREPQARVRVLSPSAEGVHVRSAGAN